MFGIRFSRLVCTMCLTGALLCAHAGAVDQGNAFEPGKLTLTQEKLSASVPTEEERAAELLVLVNQMRGSEGLSPLVLSESLGRVASIRAEEMDAIEAYTHYSISYGSAFQMMKSAGIPFHKAAENIAWGYSNTAEVLLAWANSPSHRANMMDPAFSTLGVGYSAQDGVWSLLFQG